MATMAGVMMPASMSPTMKHDTDPATVMARIGIIR